jgi:hypothetical protein
MAHPRLNIALRVGEETAMADSGLVGFESGEERAAAPGAVGLLGAPPVRTRFLPRLRDALRSQSHGSGGEMVVDYLTLRAVIGLLAFFLVPVVYLGNWLLFTRHVGDCFLPNPRLPGSLSGYYYTHMRNLFVGAMCAMGIFLAAYRGFDRWDSRLTNVAGLAAICIALSPTMPPSYTQTPGGPNLFFTPANACGPSTLINYQQSSAQSLFGYVHMGSLIVLFTMVFLMVLVQFTKTESASRRTDTAGGLRRWWSSLFPDEASKRKKKRRNRIYVLCAGGISLCAVLALVTAIWPSAGGTVPLLLFAECGAFAFFGIAWYVKGAASAPPDQPQSFIWVLSRPVYRWLADDRAS